MPRKRSQHEEPSDATDADPYMAAGLGWGLNLDFARINSKGW